MSANFPFQENIDVFAGEKAEKEYWIKISSKDATSTSPFNFSVKFTMNIATGKNQYLKEAIIEDKYQDIKKIEVSDVIIPRYIPNDILGLVFDGVNLIKMGVSSSYLISTYPGINMRCGVFSSTPNTYPYIKLTNQKDCVILASITSSPILSDDLSTFKYKDLKTIDHITINNIVYPILDISNNNIITLDDYSNKGLPNIIFLFLRRGILLLLFWVLPKNLQLKQIYSLNKENINEVRRKKYVPKIRKEKQSKEEKSL
jgi:hypothetical protein